MERSRHLSRKHLRPEYNSPGDVRVGVAGLAVAMGISVGVAMGVRGCIKDLGEDRQRDGMEQKTGVKPDETPEMREAREREENMIDPDQVPVNTGSKPIIMERIDR